MVEGDIISLLNDNRISSQLVQCSSDQVFRKQTTSDAVPWPWGASVGLAPPHKAPSTPKLKHETLQISVVFVNF